MITCYPVSMRSLPEGQRVRILGVVRTEGDGTATQPAADTLAGLGIEVVQDTGYGLLGTVCDRIEHPEFERSQETNLAPTAAAVNG